MGAGVLSGFRKVGSADCADDADLGVMGLPGDRNQVVGARTMSSHGVIVRAADPVMLQEAVNW